MGPKDFALLIEQALLNVCVFPEGSPQYEEGLRITEVLEEFVKMEEALKEAQADLKDLEHHACDVEDALERALEDALEDAMEEIASLERQLRQPVDVELMVHAHGREAFRVMAHIEREEPRAVVIVPQSPFVPVAPLPTYTP